MPVRLLLYSRSGCHLCDEMLSAIEGMDASQELNITVVDIDTDPALRNVYSTRIPVLVRADTCEILCENRLDKQALLSCLSRS